MYKIIILLVIFLSSLSSCSGSKGGGDTRKADNPGICVEGSKHPSCVATQVERCRLFPELDECHRGGVSCERDPISHEEICTQQECQVPSLFDPNTLACLTLDARFFQNTRLSKYVADGIEYDLGTLSLEGLVKGETLTSLAASVEDEAACGIAAFSYVPLNISKTMFRILASFKPIDKPISACEFNLSIRTSAERSRIVRQKIALKKPELKINVRPIRDVSYFTLSEVATIETTWDGRDSPLKYELLFDDPRCEADYQVEKGALLLKKKSSQAVSSCRYQLSVSLADRTGISAKSPAFDLTIRSITAQARINDKIHWGTESLVVDLQEYEALTLMKSLTLKNPDATCQALSIMEEPLGFRISARNLRAPHNCQLELTVDALPAPTLKKTIQLQILEPKLSLSFASRSAGVSIFHTRDEISLGQLIVEKSGLGAHQIEVTGTDNSCEVKTRITAAGELFIQSKAATNPVDCSMRLQASVLHQGIRLTSSIVSVPLKLLPLRPSLTIQSPDPILKMVRGSGQIHSLKIQARVGGTLTPKAMKLQWAPDSDYLCRRITVNVQEPSDGQYQISLEADLRTPVRDSCALALRMREFSVSGQTIGRSSMWPADADHVSNKVPYELAEKDVRLTEDFRKREVQVYPYWDIANDSSLDKDQRAAAITKLDAMMDCVYSNVQDSCLLKDLAPVMQNGRLTETTSLDREIGRRLLISDAWMGEVFMTKVLPELPLDVKLMLNSVTAVVISRNIKPAFYTSATGAIYLDPLYLFEQKSQVAETKDPREAYGNTLSFTFRGGFFDKSGKSIYKFNQETRTIPEITLSLSALLFHELAHANDFLPPGTAMNPEETFYQLTQTLMAQGKALHRLLAADVDRDASLIGLGQVSFQGAAPTAQQNAMGPDAVAQLFKNDNTVSYYSYSTEREDLAEIFTSLMMPLAFRDQGIAELVYIFNKPQIAQPPTRSDYTVSFMQKNRVYSRPIKARAYRVLEKILPDRHQEIKVQLDGETSSGIIENHITAEAAFQQLFDE